MRRLEVDNNLREDHRTIVIPPKSASQGELTVGERVILFEPAMECEAILRHGKSWPWVADIVEGTIKEIPAREDDTLRRKRRNAGIKAVATKGPEELSRAAKKAAWTRKHGQNEAENPFSRPKREGGARRR